VTSITTGSSMARSFGADARQVSRVTDPPAESRVIEGEVLSDRRQRGNGRGEPGRNMRFGVMPVVRTGTNPGTAAAAYAANASASSPRRRLDLTA